MTAAPRQGWSVEALHAELMEEMVKAGNSPRMVAVMVRRAVASFAADMPELTEQQALRALLWGYTTRE